MILGVGVGSLNLWIFNSRYISEPFCLSVFYSSGTNWDCLQVTAIILCFLHLLNLFFCFLDSTIKLSRPSRNGSNFPTGKSSIFKHLYFLGAAVLQSPCNTYMYLVFSSVSVKEVAAGCKPPHKHLPFVTSPFKYSKDICQQTWVKRSLSESLSNTINA